jgi:hypothetical protein
MISLAPNPLPHSSQAKHTKKVPELKRQPLRLYAYLLKSGNKRASLEDVVDIYILVI